PVEDCKAGLGGHAGRFGGQPRLADAWLTGQDDGLSLAEARLLAKLAQYFDVRTAPDQQGAESRVPGRAGVGHAGVPRKNATEGPRSRCGCMFAYFNPTDRFLAEGTVSQTPSARIIDVI